MNSDLLKVESSHEMTQKVRNEPARRPMPAVQAHRLRQSFPNQQAQNVGYPPFHNQHQQHPHQQQKPPWNGRPVPQVQQHGQNGNGIPMSNPYGAPPMNQYNNNNGPNMHRSRPPHLHQNHMNNPNGGGQGQQYPNRTGGSLPGGFNNSGPPPGIPSRPPGGGGNPYVPPAPFALAPSRGRPPSGPRGSNGPQAGPGGPSGMLPKRPHDSNLNSKPNGNGGGGSGQSGLPY